MDVYSLQYNITRSASDISLALSLLWPLITGTPALYMATPSELTHSPLFVLCLLEEFLSPPL